MLNIIYYSLISVFAYLVSLSNAYIPQAIALASIILLYISLRKKTLNLFLLAFIVTLLIFSTKGLGSPLFFLIYFLLFVIAFQNPPHVTLSYSLVLIILLSITLDNNSILPLLSLLFITPIAWFVGHQYLEKQKTDFCIAADETAFMFWLTLKFKTGILKIIDSASILLSQPQLSPTQKDEIKFIKDSAKNLLNSSKKLTDEIEHSDDEI